MNYHTDGREVGIIQKKLFLQKAIMEARALIYDI